MNQGESIMSVLSKQGIRIDTKISYDRSEEAWRGYEQLLMTIIREHNIKRVCDVGGGANPLLKEDYVRERGIDYSILDISKAELDKAPVKYDRILADISSPDFSTGKRFGLVFSKMLAEHISNAEQFHRNVLGMLADNGLAVHFFPTLYTLPFLVNRLVPEFLTDILLRLFAPRDRCQHAKFPAYYRWCRGPISSQIQKFGCLGYDVIEYRGFFGHGDYYRNTKMLRKLHELKTDYLLRNPNPLLTSYAFVVLKKASEELQQTTAPRPLVSLGVESSPKPPVEEWV